MKFERGSLTIEAAIVLPVLVFTVFSAIELSRLMMTHAGLERAVASAARELKLRVVTGDYGDELLTKIRQRDAILIDSKNVVLDTVTYYQSPQDVIDQVPSQLASSAFAKYSVNYDFYSLSPWLGDMTLNAAVMVKHEL
jgi:hypothetical protein